MPRPRKPEDERRTETIAFRVTPAERLQAEMKAAAAGLPGAPEYARTLTLKGRVVVEQRRELDHAVFDELRRIGVNLNQLARIANQTGQVPGRLESALAALEQILAREIGETSARRAQRPVKPPAPGGPRGP